MPLHGTPCGAASDHHALSVHSLALSFSCSLSPSLGPSGPAARSEAPPPLAPTQLPAFRAGPEITGTATHTQNNPPESIFTQNARLLVEGLAHALEGPLATPALALRDGPLGLGLPLYSVLLVGLFLVLLGLFILDSLWLDGLLVGLFILLVGLFIVYC